LKCAKDKNTNSKKVVASQKEDHIPISDLDTGEFAFLV